MHLLKDIVELLRSPAGIPITFEIRQLRSNLLEGDPIAAVVRALLTKRQSAVGKDLRLDGQLYTVVGVMPKGFYFLNPTVMAWRPLAFTSATTERSVASVSPTKGTPTAFRTKLPPPSAPIR